MMQLLMFADDTVLLAETEEDLHHIARVQQSRKQQQWFLVGSRWIVVWVVSFIVG